MRNIHALLLFIVFLALQCTSMAEEIGKTSGKIIAQHFKKMGNTKTVISVDQDKDYLTVDLEAYLNQIVANIESDMRSTGSDSYITPIKGVGNVQMVSTAAGFVVLKNKEMVPNAHAGLAIYELDGKKCGMFIFPTTNSYVAISKTKVHNLQVENGKLLVKFAGAKIWIDRILFDM